MAGLATRPFFTDNPGSLPYTYVVPGSVELEVQSIVARFDGAGAAGAFLPCLSIYTQDGHLLARVRPDQEFAIGDTGVVTWGPFLRRQVAATPSGATAFTFIHRESTPAQVIASGTGGAVRITFAGGTMVNTDATRFGTAGVPANSITVLKTGTYLIKLQIHWDVAFNGICAVIVRSSGWTWDKEAEWEQPYGASLEDAGGPVVTFAMRLPAGTSTIEFLVRQNSGANQTLESAVCEVLYLGSFSGEPADPDTY